jgi:hypothetical protein
VFLLAVPIRECLGLALVAQHRAAPAAAVDVTQGQVSCEGTVYRDLSCGHDDNYAAGTGT